jgi:ferrochelatase
MTKTAVILFNLGGPDSQRAVKPFLFNLFKDPAILRMSALVRKPLAWLIATTRAGKARHIYQQIGGKSPILENTQAQAKALEELLLQEKGDYKIFVSMRYWHPMSDTVARNVKTWDPDRIILLPLYPQFSTTTTASSFADWEQKAKACGLENVPTIRLCCYPTERNLIAAHVNLLKDAYWKASEHGRPRILFSAHGLPEKISSDGDPYSWQIKETAMAIVRVLAIDDTDYSICYQSRVGRLEWIGPSTEEEIARAGEDRKPVVVVPVSFVSEHSETLVELDIEYRTLAEREGVPGYHRVPAIGVEPFFIEALAEMCKNTDNAGSTGSHTKNRICPRNFDKCPCG